MQFTSPYDDERMVPLLNERVVKPGETVPVPAHLAIHFVQTWRPADAEAEEAVADYQESLVEFDDEPDSNEED